MAIHLLLVVVSIGDPYMSPLLKRAGDTINVNCRLQKIWIGHLMNLLIRVHYCASNMYNRHWCYIQYKVNLFFAWLCATHVTLILTLLKLSFLYSQSFHALKLIDNTVFPHFVSYVNIGCYIFPPKKYNIQFWKINW